MNLGSSVSHGLIGFISFSASIVCEETIQHEFRQDPEV